MIEPTTIDHDSTTIPPQSPMVDHDSTTDQPTVSDPSPQEGGDGGQPVVPRWKRWRKPYQPTGRPRGRPKGSKKKRKRGRPKKPKSYYKKKPKTGPRYKKFMKSAHTNKLYHRWMPYEAACMTVQSVGTIKSRQQYWKWHDKIRPYYLPKHPHRVYKDKWVSWNDYLGVEMSWNGDDLKVAVQRGKDWWMPYWDAVRFVQKMGLENKIAYKKAYEEGLIDPRIPKAPEWTYGDQWTGWKSFLGKTAHAVVIAEVRGEEKKVGILALCTNSKLPQNMVEIVVAPDSKVQLAEKMLERPELRVGRQYVWEPELWPQIKAIFAAIAVEQGEGVFMVPNVAALVYELDNVLLLYRD